MGPVRRRHLIRGLAIVASLNMVVALVALYAHAGDASARESRTHQAAATSSTTGPGILGGQFTKRRGTGSAATHGTAAGGTAGSGADGSGDGGSGAATNGSGGPGPGTGAGGNGSAATGSGAPSTPGAGGMTGTNGSATSGTATTTGPSGGGSAGGGASTGRPAPGGTSGAASGDPNQPGTLGDPAGDTIVDGTTDPIKEGRADIVRAGAAYGPGGLTFTLQVAQPDDPRTDAKWAADSTFAVWSVDTDGDGKPDYDIQFSRDGNDLSGDVSHAGDNGASVCDASSATYGPDGYTVTIDPACLGNPPAVAFRATMYYDTNPKNDNSDVASDVAPNGGLSFPVSRPS